MQNMWATICGRNQKTLQRRLYEHLRDIGNGDQNKPLGRHFLFPQHNKDTSKISAHILSFISMPSDTSAALQMRLKFERDWIFQIRTNLPHGLNAMD